LSNAFDEVAGVVTENINTAADNLSSVVASAYSVLKQKTVDLQESLVTRGLSDPGHDSSGSEEDISSLSRSASCEPEEAEIAVEDDSNIMDDLLQYLSNLLFHRIPAVSRHTTLISSMVSGGGSNWVQKKRVTKKKNSAIWWSTFYSLCFGEVLTAALWKHGSRGVKSWQL